MKATSKLPKGGRTRLAPTPSGYLHAGNAFNFLLTERLAKASQSRLILRIDDLDAERKRPEYIEDIFRSLEWLGIEIDEGPSGPADFEQTWSQSVRVARYGAMAEDLCGKGMMYPCTCSRSQLEALERNGSGHLCREVRANEFRTSSDASWRLRLDWPCPVNILTLSRSSEEYDLSVLMNDPVLVQRDSGRPAYQLASLCDDVDMDVTFIVRGLDLVPSTVCQARLAELLGLSSFGRVRFLHHPLLTGRNGQKLSKSAGAESLQAMRSAGMGPDALIRAVDAYFEELGSRLSG